MIHFAPYTVDLIKLAPSVLPLLLPHLPKLVVHIDKMGPLIGKTVKYQEYILPVVPGLLENIDYLVLLVDLLIPHFDKIAPHSEKLFAHFKILIPHVPKVAAHADALMPFLEKEGWDTVLPYVDHIAPYIDELAPHAEYLLDDEVYDKLIDRIPVFAPYIGNLVPVVDKLAPLLPVLVPYIDAIPLSVQREFLKSKSACRTLPAMVKVIPGLRTDLNRTTSSSSIPTSHYPMPKSIVFKINATEKVAVGNEVVVFYRIFLNSGGSRTLRYSSLRTLHKRLEKSIRARNIEWPQKYRMAKLNLPKFPPKTNLGRRLSSQGIEKRRLELEEYLRGLANMPQLLELPIYHTFVQAFVVSSMIPPEYFKRIEEL